MSCEFTCSLCGCMLPGLQVLRGSSSADGCAIKGEPAESSHFSRDPASASALKMAQG